MRPWDRQVTDEELVERTRKGDVESYSELVRRYRQRIYQTIFRFTRNHGDSDDLSQETFFRAFQKLGQFRRQAQFYTWIYRIAVNLSLNLIKKRKDETAAAEYDDGRAASAPTYVSSPEEESESRELGQRIEAAVASLPLPYRSCFILVAFEGMSHAQAARVLRCAENTVAWRMHKARKMLQAKLRPYLDEVSDDLR